MKDLFRFTIKSKLFFMVSVGIIPLIILGTSIYIINIKLENKTRNISTLILPGILTAHNILTHLERIRINEYRHCFTTDTKEKKYYEDEMNYCLREIKHLMRQYPHLITSKKETVLFNSLSEDYENFLMLHKRILSNSSTSQIDTAKRIMTTSSRVVYMRMVTVLRPLIGLNSSKGLLETSQIHSEIVKINLVLAIITPVILIFLIFFYYNLSRSVLRPIRLLANAADQLAMDKKCLPISVNSNDEIGSLTHSFNEMSRAITNVFYELGQLNSTLEVKVKERTQALSEMNLSLSKEIMNREKIQKDLDNKAAELKSLNEMKDLLLSVIAHDLKNSFSSILGFSSLIKQEKATLTLEEILKYSNLIHSSSEAAYKLLVNMLDWTNMITGRLTLIPASFLLRPLIEENISHESLWITKKDIHIEIDIDDAMYVFADQNMVNTIIRNLLHNALKYSFQGGLIHFTAITKENGVQLTVADQGIGMYADQVNKLFKEPMKSTPGTLKEKGSGLGLMICKNFVERNGGTLWVESKRGVGSRFIFTLPVKNPST